MLILLKRNSDRACRLVLILRELERTAYIKGDTAMAELLARQLDALEAEAVEQRLDDQDMLVLPPW